jgi:hypothetical protein
MFRCFRSTICFLLSVNFGFAQLVEGHPCADHKQQGDASSQIENGKAIQGQSKYNLHYVKLELDVRNDNAYISNGHATLKALLFIR